MAEGISFQGVWESVLDESGSTVFIKAESASQKRVLNYTFSTFFKRAGRLCNALVDELGLKPGDRVMILIEDPSDVSLLLHACWIGGLVPVPISSAVSDAQVLSALKQAPCEALVYPPEAAARVVNVAADPGIVTHWVVSGSSMSFQAIPGLKKLEDLTAAATAAFDWTPPSKGEELSSRAALVMPTGENLSSGEARLLLYTAEQLLNSAKSYLRAYPRGVEEMLCWSTLNHLGLEGLINSFIVPLFLRQPYLVRPIDDIRDFWDQMRADGVNFAWVEHEELRLIFRKGRSSSYSRPASFCLVASSLSRYSDHLLEAFEERFEVAVHPVFSVPAAGGVLACFESSDKGAVGPWRQDYALPCCGRFDDEALLKVVEFDGTELEEEEPGELIVQPVSAPQINGRGSDSEVYLDENGYVHTGYEGFYMIDSKEGGELLYVSGRRSDFRQRGDEYVNIGQIRNAVYTLKGVGFAHVISFPSFYTGFEIGCYVIPLVAAHLDEEEVLERLHRVLDWAECPKVVVLGDKKDLTDPPAAEDVVRLFEEHYHTEFDKLCPQG